ncbi:MAG: hypothetical protein CMJ29_02925 [Phycisphaerae bacterium]|nr:hypothetical protein [Phycisphaerae bacterium]|tara:strand:+ start:1138 stop:1584 length:447 start_codon:yes stop_codon:yes gene_type:complete
MNVDLLKHTRFLLVVCPLLLVAFGCTNTVRPQHLAGTWVGTDRCLNSLGAVETQKTWVFEVSENGDISGTTRWQLLDGKGGHDGDKLVDTHAEEVIGAFDPRTGDFYLVEMEENGIIHGRFINKDEISVFLVQSGKKPVVSHIELRRQ